MTFHGLPMCLAHAHLPGTWEQAGGKGLGETRVELSDLGSKPAVAKPLPSFEEEFFSFPKLCRQSRHGGGSEMHGGLNRSPRCLALWPRAGYSPTPNLRSLVHKIGSMKLTSLGFGGFVFITALLGDNLRTIKFALSWFFIYFQCATISTI